MKKGSDTAGAGEFVLFAEFCHKQHRRATAARLWFKAFAADAELADSVEPSFGSYFNRFNAACEAALAGIGDGVDSDTTDAEARARLRRQALDWLRQDLVHWQKQLEGDKKPSLATILANFRSSKIDTDLKGIRDEEWLARWPEEERQACRAYWADLDAVLKKYEGNAER